MKKYVCSVCGYVHEGDSAPDFCPQCKAPKEKFKEMAEEAGFACAHEIGVAKGVDQMVYDGLVANFNGECCEVGMYLAMSRQADREGYPEIAAAFAKYAFEEAEHAAKFAELLGEVVTDSTKKNLQMRAEAEAGACAGKLDIAKRAKELGYDAIHDTVHEMAKDEARHALGPRGVAHALERDVAVVAGELDAARGVGLVLRAVELEARRGAQLGGKRAPRQAVGSVAVQVEDGERHGRILLRRGANAFG